MLKRILGLLGWLGVALVFAGGGDPLPAAGVAAVVQRAGDRRPGLHAALHPQPVARDRAIVLGRQARFGIAGGRERRRSCSRSSSAINYLAVAPQQALGPDGGQAVHAVGSDQEGPAGAAASRCASASSIGPRGSPRFRERLDEYQYASKQVTVEYIDVEQRPTLANQYKVQRSARSCSSTTAASSGSRPTASRS